MTEITNLAEALSKAQGEIKPPTKSHTAGNGKYQYNYADLADVLEALRAAFAKHGLSVLQPMHWTPDGLTLETRLLHTSGESVSSSYPLPNLPKAQDMGSAITYARRYSLCALVGIAAEDDDDGKAATDSATDDKVKAPRTPPKPEAPEAVWTGEAIPTELAQNGESTDWRIWCYRVRSQIHVAPELAVLNEWMQQHEAPLDTLKGEHSRWHSTLMHDVKTKQREFADAPLDQEAA